MRVRELRKVLLYLMMVVAFLSLQLSGAMPMLAIALFYAGTIASWWWEPPRINMQRWARPWTILTLGMFGWTLVSIFAMGTAFINAGLDFVLFLATAKLFQRAEDKDYTQAMALSLLLLAAGAVMNDGLTFGLMFAFYVVVATLGLTVQHVSVEVTTFHGSSAAGMRIERAIVWATAVLGLLVFLGSAGFFVTFPRVGLGFFMSQNRSGLQTSGFGDTVDLGGHGTIRADSSVVMRVVFREEPGLPIEEIHWRGLSLDFYNGRSWADRDERTLGIGRREDTPIFFVARGADNGGLQTLRDTTIEAEINLEPIGSSVLFGIGPLQAIELPGTLTEVPQSLMGREVTADESGEVRLETRSEAGVRYIMYSRPNAPSLNELRDAQYGWGDEDLRQAVWNAWRALEGNEGAPVEPPVQFTEAQLNAVAAAADQRPRGEGPGRDGFNRRVSTLAKFYLQLPDGFITPRMAALTAELRAENPDAYAFTGALENWLRTQLRYTTDLTAPASPESNVIDEFLFEWRAGHCEYFAAGMVILLRQQGIPARIVNGYLGGDYNAVGQYYAVRQANAHSWVEVFFPGLGWIEFDPTPAGAVSMGASGFFGPAIEFYDSLKLLWFRWVVEYDLESQVSLLRDTYRAVAGEEQTEQMDAPDSWLASTIRQLFFRLLSNVRAVSYMMLLGMGVTFAFRRRGHLRQPWSRIDWGIGAGWLAASFIGTAVFWRQWPQTEAVVISIVIPVAGTILAKIIRGALLAPDTDPEARRSAATFLISQLYASILRDVEAFTGPLPLSLTTAELIRRVEGIEPAAVQALEQFLAVYRESRFGGTPVPPETQRALRQQVKALRSQLRKAFKAQLRAQKP